MDKVDIEPIHRAHLREVHRIKFDDPKTGELGGTTVCFWIRADEVRMETQIFDLHAG